MSNWLARLFGYKQTKHYVILRDHKFPNSNKITLGDHVTCVINGVKTEVVSTSVGPITFKQLIASKKYKVLTTQER